MKVNYNIYDVIDQHASFFTRTQFVKDVIGPHVSNDNNLRVVHTLRTTYENRGHDITKFYAECMARGYEGAMVRWGNEGYKMNGRSSSLLKYKKFIDIAAEIIDVVPNASNPIYGTPVLRFTHEVGREVTFKAGCKLNFFERKKLLLNKDEYIGKIGEVRFFEWTDDMIPRFPTFLGVREDKSVADVVPDKSLVYE